MMLCAARLPRREVEHLTGDWVMHPSGMIATWFCAEFKDGAAEVYIFTERSLMRLFSCVRDALDRTPTGVATEMSADDYAAASVATAAYRLFKEVETGGKTRSVVRCALCRKKIRKAKGAVVALSFPKGDSLSGMRGDVMCGTCYSRPDMCQKHGDMLREDAAEASRNLLANGGHA